MGADKVKQAELSNILVVDGAVSYSGLNEANKSMQWLLDKLQFEDKKQLENVILATYDSENDSLSVHTKDN